MVFSGHLAFVYALLVCLFIINAYFLQYLAVTVVNLLAVLTLISVYCIINIRMVLVTVVF